MITQKTNPPKFTESKVTPADMLRTVLVAGKSTRTAALQLCYSSAAFILLVNHFCDVNDKKRYMSKSDAIAYLQKQISDQADVKGGMLDLYIRNASQLCTVLLGSPKMFSDTIQRVAAAEDPDTIVSILSKWMDDNHGKRVESMSNLSEALGFKTGRPNTPAATLNTPTKAVEKIDNALTAIEKAVDKGDVKGLRDQQISQVVAAHIKSKVALAVEAIKQIAEEAELKAVEAAIKDHRKTLARLSADAKANVKNGTTALAAALSGKAKSKGKAKPATRTAA